METIEDVGSIGGVWVRGEEDFKEGLKEICSGVGRLRNKCAEGADDSFD